jgi:type I restriction enzyme S subunit
MTIANEGGRAHGLLNVTTTDFFNIRINVPGFDEQKEISQILSVSNKEIQLLQNKLDQIKDQKKGLMQILLTGKKRLNVN